ncbi:MAG: hypothetical protein J4G04_08620 [Nitrosopumilaceae archaeon]|nr:hypothetical protein [Nitrosopumilaceae archaeon]
MSGGHFMGCECCKWWNGVAGGSLRVAETLATLATLAGRLAGQNDSGEDTIRMLQAIEEALADDNQNLAQANRRLNARKNTYTGMKKFIMI